MQTLETLATAYIQGQAVEPTASEAHTFEAWVNHRFDKVAFMTDFINEDTSPSRCWTHYQRFGRLLISTANNTDNLWGETVNARFRAVHDWDHICSGWQFDLAGEIAAFKTAAFVAPEPIRWILYSEIVLQAAASIYTGNFNEQKLVRV